MTETLRIHPAKRIYSAIITLFLVVTVFLFWLGLSAVNLKTGLLPVLFAIAFGWMASIWIRRPFSLVITPDGLLIETPFGDSFFGWSGFESFAIKYVDPITKHIVFKLKPEVEVPWVYRRFRRAEHEVGLYPYFEIGNNELLKILRKYRYSS